MRKIKLRGNVMIGNEQLSSLAILRMVTTSAPGRALPIDEIRRRVRILDQLDELPVNAEYLLLEDEDARILTTAIEGFPWAAASRGLLSVIDDVLTPETVPAKLVSETNIGGNGAEDTGAAGKPATVQGA